MTTKKHSKECERCRNKIIESKVSRDLYNTWNAKYFRLWTTFEEFYREVGNPPGPQYMLSGAIPGTSPRPGNTRWLERDGELPTLQHWTLTDYDQMKKDAGLNKLAAAAFHAYHQTPNSMVTFLTHLEQDHLALKRDNLQDWQLELEQMAHLVAVEKFEQADQKAEGKGRGSQTKIGREFRNKLVPILALRLEENHKAALTQRSGRHHGLIKGFLPKLDYLTIAHITMTTVFDCIGRGSLVKTTLTDCFEQVGQRLDHEAFFRFLKEADPQAMSRIDRYVLQNEVKGYEYKINEAKARTEASYFFMGVKDRAKLGDWCFANLQSLTLWFETYKMIERVGKKPKLTYFLSLSQEGLKYRDLMQAAQDERAYEAWPMVAPPLEWEFNDEGKPEKRGGYLTLHPGKYSTVIRQNKGTIPSDIALDALHNMQSRPFRVNPFIYETMKGLLSGSHEIGKFRTYERDSWDDLNKPQIDPQVWDNKYDQSRNITPEYKKAMSDLEAWHQNREIADKERVTPFRVLMMAARFLHADQFYLPTYFDNRLRMYYMVDTLNPQGSDYQKALLEFANGNQVTTENIKQVHDDLLVTMANAAAWDTPAGKSDKLSIEGRQAWALDMVKRLEDEATDPVNNRKFWTECDEPFQYLAALHEYYSIFVWCTSTIARVPNGRDATNSGSQLIGGIIRDPKTCFYCNVTSTWSRDVLTDEDEMVTVTETADTPQDLYGVVAQEAQILLKADPWLSEQKERARSRAKERMEELQANGVKNPVSRVGNAEFNVPPEVVDRKITKRPSMCTAYGASWRSKNGYVSEELDKAFRHPDGKKASLCEKIIITNSAIQGQDNGFPGLAKMNRWFRKLAQACLKKGLKLVHWKTPNGSYVVQEYLEPQVEEVMTYAMGGAKYWKPIKSNGKRGEGVAHLAFTTDFSSEIKESKTQTALAANWTHAHDAVIVQNTVHDWDGDYFAVHDCFYGPAGTMEEMTKKARKALYDIITSDPLGKLIDGCGVDVVKPHVGTAPIEQVLDNPYTIS